MATYTSYIQSFNDQRSRRGQVKPGQRVAVKIVASCWENHSGRYWAAYFGDSTQSDDEVADHGTRLPVQLAQALFPQIVAAGFDWWD